MTPGEVSRDPDGFTVLLIDSDPAYLDECSRLITNDGHTVRGAEDLNSAADFLTDQTPDVIAADVSLLGSLGADSVSRLRELAPAATLIIAGVGAPDDASPSLSQGHDIFGYHDKSQGGDGLCLWIRAALACAQQGKALGQTRQLIGQVLESVPHLHRIQSLDDVLEAILERSLELMGGQNAFVAARMSDPVGKPPIEGFSDSTHRIDDYVVGAATAEDYPKGTTVDKLSTVPTNVMERAVAEQSHLVQDYHGVLPLTLADHVLGLTYLDRPAHDKDNRDILQLFGSQAAAAIRNAVLFELATVDATTRVFQKAFTLDRLRETLKLAWRKAFPVSVLMIDIDSFKELNDLHGHVVGDRALRHLGGLLKDNVRDSDIVGRFGGDEFLVVLIDANHQGADIVAERLNQALAAERGRPWPGALPPLKTSMGMASLDPGDVPPMDYGLPDFAQVIDALVHEADTSMYAARREAKGMFAGRTLTWAQFAGI
jgi:diguanylate cyclase (GGDEF)-like protein